uniref:Uncharacterized protein n=1 Tax=Rhizophora mucronata TaxID=61149 RepID=A0A2P2QM36_RHIMU
MVDKAFEDLQINSTNKPKWKNLIPVPKWYN